MPVSDERRRLYEDMQRLCAGHSVEVGISAVVDTLSSLIAFAATDRKHASELVQAFVPDVERTISENWSYVREVREASFRLPEPGIQ